jgi:GT2 family glycosyltransferase
MPFPEPDIEELLRQRAVHISVIVPTYYRHECLSHMLGALAAQTYPPREVIVCDQTPMHARPVKFYDNHASLFPPGVLQVIDFDEPSLAVPRNTGAERASSDYLLFLDDDVGFDKDFLENHAHEAIRTGADVITGATEMEGSPLEAPNWRNSRNHPIRYFLDHPRVDWCGMCLVIHGGNTLIRRDVFLNSGGFDPCLPRMEDHDLGYRLFRQGAVIIYSARPRIIHLLWPSGGTRKTQRNLELERLVAIICIHLKHFPGWTTTQFMLRQVINSLLFRTLVKETFQRRHLAQLLRPVRSLWYLVRAYRRARVLINTHKLQ